MKKWERETWPEQCLRYIRIFLLCHAYITSQLFTLFVKVWCSEEHYLWSKPCPCFWVVHLSSLLCWSCLSSYASPDCCLFNFLVSYLLLFLCKPPILPFTDGALWTLHFPYCLFVLSSVSVTFDVIATAQRTPVFLPGESHRQRSLGPIVHVVAESDTTEVTWHTHNLHAIQFSQL